MQRLRIAEALEKWVSACAAKGLRNIIIIIIIITINVTYTAQIWINAANVPPVVKPGVLEWGFYASL